MTLRIDDGVPMPQSRLQMKGYTATLRKLQPRQSVVLPTAYHNAYTIAWRVFGKGNFVTRTVEGGTRVWRI